MSGTIHTVVSRLAGAGVTIAYKVELTSDARALVSSSLHHVEIFGSEGRMLLTPDEARRLAVAILGALDTIDPGAVVNR